MSYRYEYGVELTWQDGTTEIHARENLLAAAHMAEWHNGGPSVCSARLRRRMITTGPWVATGASA